MQIKRNATTARVRRFNVAQWVCKQHSTCSDVPALKTLISIVFVSFQFPTCPYCWFSILYFVFFSFLLVLFFFFFSAAPRCDSFTACESAGKVLISAAASQVCSEHECTEGECCTAGISFVFCFAYIAFGRGHAVWRWLFSFLLSVF